MSSVYLPVLHVSGLSVISTTIMSGRILRLSSAAATLQNKLQDDMQASWLGSSSQSCESGSMKLGTLLLCTQMPLSLTDNCPLVPTSAIKHWLPWLPLVNAFMSILIVALCLAIWCFFMSGCVHSSITWLAESSPQHLSSVHLMFVAISWPARYGLLFVCLPFGPSLSSSTLSFVRSLKHFMLVIRKVSLCSQSLYGCNAYYRREYSSNRDQGCDAIRYLAMIDLLKICFVMSTNRIVCNFPDMLKDTAGLSNCVSESIPRKFFC